MRTVTFSKPEIQNIIGNHFVALNSNIEGDPTSGESIGHAPTESAGNCIRGNGRQNVQVIFMTPELELLHAVTGYIAPADLLVEMEFAVELFERMKADTGNRFDLVRTAHSDPTRPQRAKRRSALFQREMPSLEEQQSRLASRMTGGAFSPQSAISRDDKFFVKNPLMPMESFNRDPGSLVGRGKTFFSSSTNSSQALNKR